MIEKLNKLAIFISPLKWPALIISIALLVVAVTIAVSSSSRDEDILLIPSIVGFVWFLCIYVLISNFQNIPRKIEPEDGWLARIKVRLYRFWFLVLGLLFILTTGLVLFISYRLIMDWLSRY